MLDLFGNPITSHIVALSGGKDSTCMALWLNEHSPATSYVGLRADEPERDGLLTLTPTIISLGNRHERRKQDAIRRGK